MRNLADDNLFGRLRVNGLNLSVLEKKVMLMHTVWIQVSHLVPWWLA